MNGHRTLHRHAAIMNRMAETQGLDLTGEMARGTLSGEDWREAVMRCTCCADPEDCLSVLGGETVTVPGFCMNRDLLARLADLADAPLA